MAYDIKDDADTLAQINSIILTLDDSIKEAAFTVLASRAFGVAPAATSSFGTGPTLGSHTAGDGINSADDIGEFLAKYEHGKPADSAKLLIAWLYSQYGTKPFALDEIKTLSDETGLTIPERLDMTLKGSKKDGKAMFKSAKRGHYQLTTSGEMQFREEYGITKGNKKKPEADES